MTGLDAALRSVARRSPLLVASDYDGVLAALVNDPDAAVPDPAAMEALGSLAALPHVSVALISGRTLADLRRLSGRPPDIMLLGSHGAETSSDDVLPESQVALRDTIAREMQQIATRFPGSHVEVKPAGVAFHYRNVAADLQADAARMVLGGPAARPKLRVMEGKMIVEVTLVDLHKGSALQRLRRLVGADAVVFVGDDVTDEDAFATLEQHDVGIKVGPEPTQAPYRVDDQAEVAGVLASLLTYRAAGQDADGPSSSADA